MPWRDLVLPAVILREPEGDGLEIHMNSRTVAEGDLKDYRGMHFASGQVVTIEDDTQVQHNVLMGTEEPRHLADLLRAYRESRHWNPTRLLNRVDELGRGAAFKRLGFLAEMLLPGAEQVVRVCLTKRTAGIIKLDPSVSTRGRLNKRWGLWVNVPLRERPGPG